MKFLDFFAGIGGFRTGLERAGFEPFGYVEIDKFARKSYEAIYDTEGEWTAHDITAVTDEEWRSLRGQVDLIAGGFPCQSFSMAGKRGGFEDTRGTLFFEIARAAKEIQPSVLFLENVKGLFSHDKGRTFGTIIQTLDELGYITEWGLLNSKFWGVPQNRERVFIIAVRKDAFVEPIMFDLLKQQEENGVYVKLKDILERTVDEKFYLSDEQTERLTFNMENRKKPEDEIKVLAHRKGYRRNTQVFDKDGVTETLDTGGGGGRGHYTLEEPTIIDDQGRLNKKLKHHDISPTLRAQSHGNEPKVVEPMKLGKGEEYRGEYIPTVEAGGEPRIGASRGRNPQNPSDWTTGAPTEQRLEINQEGTNNTLTSVQKDNYVVEPLPIKEATKKGYTLAEEGDSVNFQYPDSETRRGRVGKQIANTLQAGETNQGVVEPTFRIRKLTPRECWRLQGFTDEQFDKAQEVNSNSQLYKQAGNAVTVNVIEAIANKLSNEVADW